MKSYKVLKEDGVEIDDVLFTKDELVELDSESDTTKAMLTEGFIELDEESTNLLNQNQAQQKKDEHVSASATGNSSTDEKVTDTSDEKSLYFGTQKVVGEVNEKEIDGKAYKAFTTEDGTGYTLSQEEFDAETSLK